MQLEKSEMFVWKEVHEKALIIEVLTIEPHQFKRGTAIAKQLDKINMGFKVN